MLLECAKKAEEQAFENIGDGASITVCNGDGGIAGLARFAHSANASKNSTVSCYQ
jgi:hypothetical protein